MFNQLMFRKHLLVRVLPPFAPPKKKNFFLYLSIVGIAFDLVFLSNPRMQS